MKNEGLLLVISGPTGAGKEKVIQEFLSTHKEIYYQVSVTTRVKREDDVEGEEYTFLSNKEFFDKVDKNHFLEWAEVYGNYYGTPKHTVLKKLKEGTNVLLDVDIKGALQIKEAYHDAILIFILPKSIDELKANILNSKKDTVENLLRKFNSAYNGIKSISKYNYGVVNDTVEDAVKKIENIIVAEESRVERVKNVCELR